MLFTDQLAKNAGRPDMVMATGKEFRNSSRSLKPAAKPWKILWQRWQIL